jgi:hypothetical protein
MMIAFRPVALLTLYIVRGDWRTRRESYDEVTAAIQLHLWPPSVALVSAVVAVICCVLVARQSSRRSVASCVIVTGIAGAPAIYTWLHLLGPRLMPWR